MIINYGFKSIKFFIKGYFCNKSYRFLLNGVSGLLVRWFCCRLVNCGGCGI